MTTLTLGLPQAEPHYAITIDVLRRAGLSILPFGKNQPARIFELPVAISFLRAQDIPTMCAAGAIEMGIASSDILKEVAAHVTVRLSLGVGNCRLVFCIPKGSPIQSPAEMRGGRVATGHPRIAASYLKSYGAHCTIIPIIGSVDAMVRHGMAEAIIDIVSDDGSAENSNIIILHTIESYELVLFQSSRLQDVCLAERIARRLEGASLAQSYSLLEFNIPRALVSEAMASISIYKPPTITSLDDKNWVAVSALVKRRDIVAIMEELESHGARAILESTLINCRI